MTDVHLPGTICSCRCFHMLAIVVADSFSCNPCNVLLSTFVHALAIPPRITASLMGNALCSRYVMMSGQHIAHGDACHALQAPKMGQVLAFANDPMHSVHCRNGRLSHQSWQDSLCILGITKQQQQAARSPLCLTMMRKSATLTA